MSVKPHLSGRCEFRYPFAGDEAPPGGAQVLLLTEGGVCVRGTWDNSGAFHAWAPLPDINKAKQRASKLRLMKGPAS